MYSGGSVYKVRFWVFITKTKQLFPLSFFSSEVLVYFRNFPFKIELSIVLVTLHILLELYSILEILTYC